MLATLLLAEKEPPLIDIDGTVFLQIGLFLLLVLVLWVLVFKPYLSLRKQREDGIEGARREAKLLETKTAEALARVEERLAAARQRGNDERVKLRSEGVAYEMQALGAARDAATKAMNEARGRTQTEKEAARAKLLAEAEPIAKQVAARILGRTL